ncbi:response regulator [Paenibacillus elgii]|uniref:response regulator n=1 Tax=Paenibacillus elgii TaxID=189691 RepID=UPI000FD6AAA9|nr:response regulator [Paenibacillus elgii]NEN83123.1 response regulator transcription factor [Paenibacillus elgii]
MYSLLIAEDEGWMREVLTKSTHWEECGITRIFEAANGAEALELIRKEKIDFLLTDIRMPVMDGLTLLAKVKECAPDIETVMLTGFDDFDYVRTAMRLGAYDYLLKPVHDDELMQLFLKLSRARSERQAARYRAAMEQSMLKQGLRALREQFLANWLMGRTTDPGIIRQKCKELELDISGIADSYVVILMEVDQLYLLQERYKQREVELLQFGIRNIAEEYLKNSGRPFLLFAAADRTVVWCRAEASGDELDELLHSIRSSIRSFLKVTVTVGISERHQTENDVFAASMEALKSLKMKMYHGVDQAYFFRQVHDEEDRQLFQRELQQRLLHCVVAGNEEELYALLDGLFGEIRRKKIPVRQVEHVLLLLIQMAFESIDDGNSEDTLLGSTKEEWLAKVSAYDTIDEVQSCVTSVLRLAAQAAGSRKTKKSKLIRDMLAYLEEHYREDISLQTLAERFYVNPSYLSRLFKDEVGQIFTKYLMQLRIDKAKQLLKSTHLKVYEISEAVGYGDVKYFNKIFKDLTGLTPAEYRNL